ncbi:MAG: tetratricopeptide repeat protein, partial [Acidobacteriota bacterium]
VDCRSNLLHETLPRFMVAQGRLSDEQSQELFTQSTGRGMQFGEMLIQEGLIDASELYRTLQANLARKLLDGFTWRTGTFRLLDDLPDVDSALKVRVPQLVVTGIAKFANPEEVNGAVGPLVGKPLFLHPAPPYPIDEIRLSGTQQRLVELLENGKRIDELAAETTIPFDQIMRLLYALAVLGIVVPEDWMPTEPVEPKPKPKSVVPPATGDTVAMSPVKLASPEKAERLRNRVMAAYLRYRGQDAFDLLGVAEDANLVGVQDAYVTYSKRFAPWALEAIGLGDLADKARDLFVAGGQAFGELCDVEKRNALLVRRRNLREERKKKASDHFQIKSDLLDSERQFKRGKALMQQGKYKDALNQLQFAYDCDPQNSTYRAELSYCLFLENPKAKSEQARDELQETLRIDPKSGLAVYYLGMVQMELDDYENAEQNLHKAIKMLMPDRRPIEGLKELQTRAKQKKRRLGGLFGGT